MLTYAYPRPLYTWGISLINPKVPSPGVTIGHLSQQSTTISLEAFPLYKSTGPTVADFFQEHITYQFGTFTRLQATNEALSNRVLLYQAMAIPHTLFKVVEVLRTPFKVVVVLRTTLLESWWSYASHCRDLCKRHLILGGLVSHNLFERTTCRST